MLRNVPTKDWSVRHVHLLTYTILCIWLFRYTVHDCHEESEEKFLIFFSVLCHRTLFSFISLLVIDWRLRSVQRKVDRAPCASLIPQWCTCLIPHLHFISVETIIWEHLSTADAAEFLPWLYMLGVLMLICVAQSDVLLYDHSVRVNSCPIDRCAILTYGTWRVRLRFGETSTCILLHQVILLSLRFWFLMWRHDRILLTDSHHLLLKSMCVSSTKSCSCSRSSNVHCWWRMLLLLLGLLILIEGFPVFGWANWKVLVWILLVVFNGQL